VRIVRTEILDQPKRQEPVDDGHSENAA
jgi:hypothetical protein